MDEKIDLAKIDENDQVIQRCASQTHTHTHRHPHAIDINAELVAGQRQRIDLIYMNTSNEIKGEFKIYNLPLISSEKYQNACLPLILHVQKSIGH
jgi:hypothetical protein